MDDDFRARVRAGDEGAFGVLFREHGTAIYNHCFRLTGDWAAADDCTSRVFLEAWRSRTKVDPRGGSLLPWLLGVATRVVHRHRRVAWRNHRLMSRLPPPELAPDFADEVVGRLDDQDRIAAAMEVLNRLSRADREVLALCVWAGLDYEGAAEALGVPVGTVASRLSRARRRLEKFAEKSPGSGREVRTVGSQPAGDHTDAVRLDERKKR
ncbi:RNA polymerase sigma factor [Streptomyces sp. NPDC049040]|uniref:RNA polymerase sigma factor n=1 Tax=Streptomyces sp. NPDC049040 TaxID=3365593 RepID=UPI0037200703